MNPQALNLSSVAALIPAYRPPDDLIRQVKCYLEQGFGAVIVIDDGSGPEYGPLFASIAAIPNCTVLPHAVNLGKGRALKTGFNHWLLQHPQGTGVVAADADGQHHPNDVRAVAMNFVADPSRVVVGTRHFNGAVPFRSAVGNALTRWVFLLLSAKNLTDTQSGLRAIPRSMIPALLLLDGERYEYEMNMLLSVSSIAEHPISTIYLQRQSSLDGS